MEFSTIQYIADSKGQTTGVLIPLPLWREIQEKLAANDPLPQTTAWEVLDSLAGSVAAPPDWAAEHDHYLYGAPKREVVDHPT
jgi:hypothetical protein